MQNLCQFGLFCVMLRSCGPPGPSIRSSGGSMKASAHLNRLVLLGFLAAVGSSAVLAQSLGDMSLFIPEEDGNFVTILKQIGIGGAAVMIALLAILLLSRQQSGRGGAPQAVDQLYLRLGYMILSPFTGAGPGHSRMWSDPHGQRQAIVRSLSRSGAELILTETVAPQTELRVLLGDLPHFPSKGLALDAVVKSCRPTDRMCSAYRAWVRFKVPADAGGLAALQEYISACAKKYGPSH